jgi:hypothetical protein
MSPTLAVSERMTSSIRSSRDTTSDIDAAVSFPEPMPTVGGMAVEPSKFDTMVDDISMDLLGGGFQKLVENW